MRFGIDARGAVWYRSTGIGTYTYQLIYNLNLIDKLNEYLLFCPGEEVAFVNTDGNFNINIVGERNDRFWEQVHIPNRIREYSLDMYHVPQNGIGLPTRKESAFVVTIHDLIPYTMPETVGPSYLKIFREEMPYIIEHSDAIITVSQYSKNDIMKIFNVPEEKIYVTYLAAEEIYFPLNHKKCKEYLSEKYQISDDFILYLGGFSPRKNIGSLIKAYKEIYKDMTAKVKLAIIGKPGREFDVLVKQVQEEQIEENVIFVGFVPVEDLPYFYNSAKVFVYPSFYEGFGLPPLEAMACGTPVITSNVTSIPEIVAESAITIDPHDHLSLAEAILRLIEDPYLAHEYRLKGLERASLFSWRKTAVNTLRVYEQIVRKK